MSNPSASCPSCGSEDPVYRNPVGDHAAEDADPIYEWCVDTWHEPFFFNPPLRGQVERELET